jgi:hypothetical protein
MAAGLSGVPLAHEDVARVAAESNQRFERVLFGWLGAIASDGMTGGLRSEDA